LLFIDIDTATTTYAYEKMDATVSQKCILASPIGWICQSALQILYIPSSSGLLSKTQTSRKVPVDCWSQDDQDPVRTHHYQHTDDNNYSNNNNNNNINNITIYKFTYNVLRVTSWMTRTVLD